MEYSGPVAPASAPVSVPASVPASHPPAGARWLGSLDVLRGVAAGTVVAHHLYDLTGAPKTQLGWLLEGFGEWGVDLFFVLSAFLLSEYFWRPAGKRSLKEFYVRRAFRIGPPYYAMLGLLFLFFALPQQLYSASGGKQVLANLTFTQWLSPYTSSSLGVNGVLWTLTLEMLLYLTLPLLATAIRVRPLLASAVLIGIGMAYRVVTALNRTGLQAYYFGHHGGPSEAIQRLYMLRQYFGILPVFVVGILARWLVERGPLRTWTSRAQTRWATLVLLALLLPGLAFLKSIYRSSDYHHPYWFVGFDLVLAVLFVPALIWCVRPAAQDRKSLLFRAGQWLGIRSYSLYLWHFPIVLAVFEMGPSAHPAVHTHFLARVAVSIVACLIFAALGYRLVERPGMQAGRDVVRWLNSRRDAGRAEPAATARS